jgi:hypothetical protein
MAKSHTLPVALSASVRIGLDFSRADGNANDREGRKRGVEKGNRCTVFAHEIVLIASLQWLLAGNDCNANCALFVPAIAVPRTSLGRSHFPSQASTET